MATFRCEVVSGLGERLVLMVVSGEKTSARGRTINCRAAWLQVPVENGAASPKAFERATRPGLARILLDGARRRAEEAR